MSNMSLFNIKSRSLTFHYLLQKQPPTVVPRKRCSENMQKIYRRTPVPTCDLNKVALQLYWNHTSTWVFSRKFPVYFQNTFSSENLWVAASIACTLAIYWNNVNNEFRYTEQSPEVFYKKMFLKTSQNSQKNTTAKISFLIKINIYWRNP